MGPASSKLKRRQAAAVAELGAERVAGEHRALAGQLRAGQREGERDPPREAPRDAIGQPRHAGLLVHHHRDPQGAGRQRGGQRHEAAGGQQQRGPEPAQEPPRSGEPGGSAHREVGHVLPVPVAAQLAHRDGVEGHARLRHPARLDAALAADPLHVDAALAQARGHGQAGTRVAAGAAARDDD
jgi:hypothetical protein